MDTDVEDEDHDGVFPEATSVEIHRRGAGLLVTVGAQTQVDPVDPTALDEEWDRSDSESIESRGGTSDAVDGMEVEPVLEPPVPAVAVPVGNFLSFQWLAELDLEGFFKRPCLMKSVPGFLKGAYRSAMRVAFAEIDQGRSEEDATRSSRGWKLFLLLLRLLLHKPPRDCLVPKKQLQHRFEVLSQGDWVSFLNASMEHATRAAQASSRRPCRRDDDNLESRAARAEGLGHMGELSAARQALEGAVVAPGNRETLNALQNPVGRPPVPRDPIPQDIFQVAPTEG